VSTATCSNSPPARCSSASAPRHLEELDFTNDRYDQTVVGSRRTPRQPFNARSNIDGYFAENRIPVFGGKNALPFAHLLRASRSRPVLTNIAPPPIPRRPKYSLRYLPFNDELAFRATYSESFVAPSLYDLYGPVSVGFTTSTSITRYDANGNSLGVSSGSRQWRSQTGSNSKLDPSPVPQLVGRRRFGRRSPSRASPSPPISSTSTSAT